MLIGLAHTKPCDNQRIVFEAFAKGLHKHGDDCVAIYGFNDLPLVKKCDAVAMISYPDIVELGYKFCDEQHNIRNKQFWSIINTFRGEVYKTCIEQKKRMLCIDSGVINFKRGTSIKDTYYQIGWDKIKGLGKYYNENSPDDRWVAQHKELKDFSYDGVHIVIFGQVQYGVGSQHVDIKQWYRNSINEFRSLDKDTKIVMRLHPNSQKEPFPQKNLNIKFSTGKNFKEDISKAMCTYSFSSHSIVESILEGRPSFCNSKLSMGYPLFYAPDALFAFTNRFNMPQRSEIMQWLYNLCYTQWSVLEIQEGKMWDHLRPHTSKVEDAGFDDMLCKF